MADIELVGVENNSHVGTSVNVNYSSTAGNTLIASCNAYPGTTSEDFESGVSITDNTGTNVWQFSAGLSTNPPTAWVNDHTVNRPWLTFIGWCINAQPIDSITMSVTETGMSNVFQDATVSEWSNIGSVDTANTNIGMISGGVLPGAALTLSGSGELVYVTAWSNAVTGIPAGFTRVNSGDADIAYALDQSGSFTGNFTGFNGNYCVAASVAFLPGSTVTSTRRLLMASFP